MVSSDPGGRVKGTASLTIGARSIVGVKGNVIAITTDSYSTDAESMQKKDAVRTGAATGVGALDRARDDRDAALIALATCCGAFHVVARLRHGLTVHPSV